MPQTAPSAAPDNSQWAWTKYKSWARASEGWKQGWSRVRLAVLMLSFAALVLGPVSKGSPMIAWACAVLLAVVAFLNEQLLAPDRSQRWVKARQIAEALKSEAFRRLAGGTTDAALAARVGEITQQGTGLVLPEAEEAALVQGYPGPLDADGYLEFRVRDQQKWMRKSAAANDRTVERLRRLGWALKGIVVIAAVPGPLLARASIDAWAPVLSGVAALLATQMTQGRYQFLARSYSDASRQLEVIEHLFLAGPRDAASVAALVDGAEKLLMDENAAWVAEQLRAANPQGAKP